MPSGDGLFRKRGSPYWYTRLKREGRWRDTSTKCKSYLEAKKARSVLMAETAAGKEPGGMASWNLSRAIQHFLDYQERTKSPNTTSAQKHRLRAVQRILGGDTQLDEITSADLRNYQAMRLDERRKPATVNSELRCLIQVLRWAKLWDRLEDTYEELQVPRDSPRKALSVGEFNCLVERAIGNREWDVALCAAIPAAETTARSCEIKTLHLADIYLSGDETCPTAHIKIRRSGTKTNAGVRILPLNRPAMWALNRILDRARDLGVSASDHYVLPADLSRHTKSSDPLTGYKGFDPTRHQQSWRSAWRSLKAAAGLPWLHFHDLRHTAITDGRRQGVEMDAMRRLAGHLSKQMTDYYTHLGADDLVEAVNKIEAGNPELAKLLGIAPPHD